MFETMKRLWRNFTKTPFVVRLIKIGFPYRFYLARLSKIPILGKLLHYTFFDKDEIIYLPRNKVVALNRSLDEQENIVLPTIIVEHFINQATHHWIMDFCICRDSANCTNYPIELGCLFLGEAVLNINPKLGRLVTKAEALAHIEKCQEAGLVHLIGKNKLDSIWLNVRPGSKLLTICHCCPCCCLWKMIPDLSPGIQNHITKMPGVKLTVTEKCTGCGKCSESICFVNAISIHENRAIISDVCRGCGRCVEICPKNAIEIAINSDSDFIEESIRRISSVIDLS